MRRRGDGPIPTPAELDEVFRGDHAGTFLATVGRQFLKSARIADSCFYFRSSKLELSDRCVPPARPRGHAARTRRVRRAHRRRGRLRQGARPSKSHAGRSARHAEHRPRRSAPALQYILSRYGISFDAYLLTQIIIWSPSVIARESTVPLTLARSVFRACNAMPVAGTMSFDDPNIQVGPSFNINSLQGYLDWEVTRLPCASAQRRLQRHLCVLAGPGEEGQR